MIKQVKDGVLLSIKVIPRASSNAITGIEAERLRVRVTAVPDRGKANAAVETLIAKTLQLSRKQVAVVKGKTSRQKEVLITGLTVQEVSHLLPHE